MPVLKVVLLICALVHADSLINVRANAPWFQNILNNQGNNNLLGNGAGGSNNFMMGLLKGKNTRCNGTGADTLAEGVCQAKKECRRGGGTASGNCNFVGSCCIFETTCSNDTNAKISYFTSPRLFTNFCPMRIRLFNNNVCQIRLDFERFSIAGPNPNGLNYDCDDDQFTVNGLGNLGFQVLCGQNTGQHIYIPVNSTQGVREIMLNFNLQTNRTGLTIPMPDWRIKVTQLECGLANQVDLNSIQSPLTILYQNQKNKKNNAARDSDLIAPPGCLQYYTEPQGTYSSFNYNGAAGPMVSNTNYAVCFKRSSNTCGISHFGQTFNVSGNFDGTNAPTGLGAECTRMNATDPENGNYDWVLIPGGTIAINGTTNTSDYYCLASLNQRTVTSRAPGPLYVVVNTDGGRSTFFSEAGFQINYNLLNQC